MALSAAERKRDALTREIETALAGGLAPWEVTFAKWLSMIGRTTLRRQSVTASELAGTMISPRELRQLKYRKAFRDYMAELGGGQLASAIDEAREIHGQTIVAAAKAARKAVAVLDDSLVKATTSDDPLAAVRAAPPVLQPFIDRAWPKQQEAPKVPVNIEIRLTVAQAAAWSAPEIVVEAEELTPDVEIVE
jgi:hypothetical protein